MNRIIRFVLLLGLLSLAAFAQTAQITGAVSDQTGANVPNAAVTATNINSGVARSTVWGQLVPSPSTRRSS